MKANARTTQISSTQAQRILERDCHRCVACGRRIEGARRSRWDVHLRIPRPAPGQPDDPRVLADSNLVTICGVNGTRCSGLIREYPAAARARGLVLWRTDRPWLTPVQVWTDRFSGHLLDDEGTVPYVLDDDGGRATVAVQGRRITSVAEFLGAS